MKFTQDHAFETLKSELTNKGRKTLRMSEKSLSALVETLLPQIADDEMGLDEFVEKVKPIVSAFNSNIEKDQSKFVAKWKEEHPDTNPPTDPEPPKPTGDPALKAYEERIAALEKKLADADTKSVLAQKRSDLTAKLKEKGVKDEKWLDKYLSKVNINADTDVDAEVEDTLSLYNLNKANGGNPVPPANPNGGAQTESRYSNAIKAAAELAKSNREAGIVITE